MYDSASPLRSAGRHLERPRPGEREQAAQQALSRIDKMLTAWLFGMRCDPSRLGRALEAASPREQPFARGWLAWLDGDLSKAETWLRAASPDVTDNRDPLSVFQALRSAYWLARVGLLLGHAEAVAGYEAALRRLGGTAQATAWYVDLLWRAGKLDRAEQVWKSVRGNRRVLACDEAPLLDARLHLRRGELGPGEKLLREATPGSGVVWVEKHLLLAWTLIGLRQPGRAQEMLRQAAEGPYPQAALATWHAAVMARVGGPPHDPAHEGPAWQAFLEGQKARGARQEEAARQAYRTALALAPGPFVHHALVCLGDAEGTTPSAPPGQFFALRWRTWQAIDRFRRRELTPADLLESLQQARNLGYEAGEAFRLLATILQERCPDLTRLDALVRSAPAGVPQRNMLRIASEVACRVGAEAGPVLTGWLELAEEEGLREAIGRQLLRLGQEDEERVPPGASHLAALLRGLRRGEAVEAVDHPAARLWQAARLGERIPVEQMPSAYRPVAVALALHQAILRGDLAEVARWLDDPAWATFRAGPPAFVLPALAWLAGRHPTDPLWRNQLPGWLRPWQNVALGPEGATLALAAGVPGGEHAEPPVGTERQAWLLHQAARAALREDAVTALAFARRAGPFAEADRVLAGLERRADAQSLARCLGDPSAPGLLADLIDLLQDRPEGRACLDAARSGDAVRVQAHLVALAGRPGEPARLQHHLALLFWRAAQAGGASAWQPAWRAWLAFLASDAGPPPDQRAALLAHLIGHHRTILHDLLGRSDLEQARMHWDLVQSLPDLVPEQAIELAGQLRERAASFRDELATTYLLTTREAMRFGASPEGWRADYDRGLNLLRRLLSLDRDNVRLLTTLVEVCSDWFLDLYHTRDHGRLRDEVARYTPLAAQLAHLLEQRSGELSARTALAEFYKYRGFIEPDPQTRAALYREALRFDPHNDNVRDLLSEREGEKDDGGQPL